VTSHASLLRRRRRRRRGLAACRFGVGAAIDGAASPLATVDDGGDVDGDNVILRLFDIVAQTQTKIDHTRKQKKQMLRHDIRFEVAIRHEQLARRVKRARTTVAENAKCRMFSNRTIGTQHAYRFLGLLLGRTTEQFNKKKKRQTVNAYDSMVRRRALIDANASAGTSTAPRHIVVIRHIAVHTTEYRFESCEIRNLHFDIQKPTDQQVITAFVRSSDIGMKSITKETSRTARKPIN
jgi:hypothetical protein